MGHADHEFAQSKLPAALDDLLESRDQGFTTLQAEPLCASILLVEELLEDFRPR